MKITKRPDVENPKKILKQKALEGCNTCPCCGETRQYLDTKRIIEAIQNNKLISYEGVDCLGEVYIGGIFNIFKNIVVTRYKCHTCGAEWESEPYEHV